MVSKRESKKKKNDKNTKFKLINTLIYNLFLFYIYIQCDNKTVVLCK